MQCTGFAQQYFQEVIYLQARAGLGDQPLMPGDFRAFVVNDQMRGVEQDPDRVTDRSQGHRISDGADGDLRAAIHAQVKHPAGLEVVVGKWLQQRLRGMSWIRTELLSGGPAALRTL